MTDHSTSLTRRQILDALGRVGDRLARRSLVGDIHIVAGAVMVTEYDARPSTADIDSAASEPHGEIHRAAAEVAASMRLPRHWLNEQASAFVPRSADGRRSRS